MRIIERELAAGVAPEDIAFVSFTRRAVSEAKERISDQLGVNEEQLPHFRTLHSMAFRAAGVSSDEIMNAEQYSDLFRLLGLKEAVDVEIDIDDTVGLPRGDSIADHCVRVDALARLMLRDPADVFRELNPRDMTLAVANQFSTALREFKDVRGLIDFTDLLEIYNEQVPARVFIIDEAQDLSALQWRVARTAAKNAERVYMAGDDDQAIYGWAGANAFEFLSFKGHKEFLQQSHRLPKAVARKAKEVLQRIRQREQKTFAPREVDGSVEWVREPEYIDLGKRDEWLLLARNTNRLGRYVKLCRSQGRHYSHRGRSSLDTPYYKAARSWERGRRGEPLRPAEVKQVRQFLPVEVDQPKQPITLKELPLPPALQGATWMDALTLIPPEEREYIRSVMANGERANERAAIRIETIHTAKGAEASNVALMTDISKRVFDQRNTDDEARVLYVGLTRPKERLLLVAPRTVRHYVV